MKILLIAIIVMTICCFPIISFAETNDPELSEDRLSTLQTIQKLTDDEEYNIYSMDVLYEYDLDNLTPVGSVNTQKIFNLAIREAIPGYDLDFEAPEFGCSVFSLKDSDGTVRFGRNYDFKINTSCMIVHCHPKDGYASVAHAALNNLQADDPDSSVEAKAACLLSPFMCLDGMNEKGVGIAVLTLDSDPVVQNTGKPVLATPILIRLILDRAASTEEAVKLLENYDMYATSGRDYHFYITDKTGDSRIIEFDPMSSTRSMTVTPVRTATNFYAMYGDKVEPNRKNGIYGHGKERWIAIEDIINAKNGIGDLTTAWSALKSAAQDPDPDNVTSNTQWSIIYNLNDLSYEMVFRRDWNIVHHFSLK